jgi:hypothetical protein
MSDSDIRDAEGAPNTDAAILASMGYLHSIALVLTAGVVAGLVAGLGYVLVVVFEATEFAVFTFLTAGILGVAFLISSLIALARADTHRNRTRLQPTMGNNDPLMTFEVTLVTDEADHAWEIRATDPEAALFQALAMMPSTVGLFAVWDPEAANQEPLLEHERTRHP